LYKVSAYIVGVRFLTIKKQKMNRRKLNDKAKKYLDNTGFGSGTNITLHSAKCLMVDFYIENQKLFCDNCSNVVVRDEGDWCDKCINN
jgi:hypothetical protein